MATSRFNLSSPVVRSGANLIASAPPMSMSREALDKPVQQIESGGMFEFADSREIEAQYGAGARIVTTHLVEGNPSEAFLSSALDQNYRIPAKLPVVDERGNAILPNCYLVSQNFRHHVQGRSDDVVPITMVTSTFEQRPSPGFYEERSYSQTVSLETWFVPIPDADGVFPEPDSPQTWKRLGLGNSSVPILYGMTILERTYPMVPYASLTPENGEVGYWADHNLYTRNSGLWSGYTSKMWMMIDRKIDLIYGKPHSDSGIYRVTFRFLLDRFRKHDYWQVKFDVATKMAQSFELGPGNLLRASDLHEITELYPTWERNWDTLVTNLPDPDAP